MGREDLRATQGNQRSPSRLSNLNKPKLLQFYREEVFRKHSSTGCTVGQVVHCIRAPAEEGNGS